MDLLRDMINIQNKTLLQKIADDYFSGEEKDNFIKKYDKQLLKFIPIEKRDNISVFKAQINSKYLR